MNGQGSYGLKFYIALINITQKTQTVADALRACKTLSPRFTDFCTDFEKKPNCFEV